MNAVQKLSRNKLSYKCHTSIISMCQSYLVHRPLRLALVARCINTRLVVCFSTNTNKQHDVPLSLPGNDDLRNFVDRLKTQTNVSQYIELPMIAVMGDTSSGKSSLLSSISGVELPSSSELTTRCPIMLDMNRADIMHATVDVILKNKTSNNAKKYEAQSVSAENWKDLASEISLAQEYIIEVCGKEVSRDIVHVKVSGPQCEDLTLVDLPGIVRATGVNERASIVEDIQDLIREYLVNKRCIILAVVPANVDFHNSQILADAGKVDPETKRTIPVITKPDLIDAGAEGDVKDLLLGRKTSKFEMGFHMVKGRGQASLNLDESIETSLHKEDEYFKVTSPWRDISERTLFGTSALRSKLGSLYMESIRSSLPEIINEMEAKMEKAVLRLSALGDVHTTLAEKRFFLQEIQHELSNRIESFLEGTGSEPESSMTGFARFHVACGVFKESILQGRLANISHVTVGTKVIVVDNGSEIGGTVVGLNENGDYFIDYQDRLTKNRTIFCRHWKQASPQDHGPNGNGHLKDSGTWVISRGDQKHDELLPTSKSLVRRDSDWIINLIKSRRGDNLPIFVDSDVFKKMVVTFISEDWRNPCHRLIKEVETILLEFTESCREGPGPCRRYQKLNDHLIHLMTKQIGVLLANATVEVDSDIEREYCPYTQDHYLFENLSKKRFDVIKNLIYSALSLDTPDSAQDRITRSDIQTILDGSFDKNQRKSIDVHQSEEMVNALEAYGKVALKRFTDNIPMACSDILRKFKKSIAFKLQDDELERLMVDSQRKKIEFDELTAEVKTLRAGMDALDSLR